MKDGGEAVKYRTKIGHKMLFLIKHCLLDLFQMNERRLMFQGYREMSATADDEMKGKSRVALHF